MLTITGKIKKPQRFKKIRADFGPCRKTSGSQVQIKGSLGMWAIMNNTLTFGEERSTTLQNIKCTLLFVGETSNSSLFLAFAMTNLPILNETTRNYQLWRVISTSC